MEKRWDEPRLPTVQTVVTGTAVIAVLLLGVLSLGAGVFVSGLGGLIAKAVVAVVRSVFSALGGVLAR